MKMLDQILKLYGVRMIREDSEFPTDVMCLRGCYCLNNGTLAVVDTNADVWLIRINVFSSRVIDNGFIPLEILSEWMERYHNGQFVFDILEASGYQAAGFWVPHSNDCGTWMKKNSPVTQAQLITDMVQEKRTAETEARIQRIRTASQIS